MSFPQIPRQVIVGLFYAVPLLLLLEMNLHKPAKLDYTVYDEFYQQSDDNIKATNDTIIWFIRDGTQNLTFHEPALEKALLADSIVKRLFNKTEQLKNYLIKESISNKIYEFHLLRDLEDQCVIRNYFYIKHGADTLQAAINQTFNSLLTTLHGRDTEILPNVINYNWYSKNNEALRFLGPTDGGYKANENW
jgi:hypothetical protein